MSAGPGGAEPLQRIDLHTHTYYSPDGVTSPRRFVETCRRKGLTCVAVTDHNTVRGALAVKEIAPFTVIVGEEIRSSEGEIIGLFLSEEVPAGCPPRRRSSGYAPSPVWCPCRTRWTGSAAASARTGSRAWRRSSISSR